MRTVEWARRRNPLPTGTVVVGAGLAVTGAASYVFLVVTGHVLGPERFGALSVLWAMVFFVGPGFFVPFQQEVGRALSARHVRGVAGGAVIRRATWLGLGLAGVLIVVCAIAAGPITDHVFSGDATLLAALMLSVLGYLVANLVQGAMSGSGQFGRYAAYLGGEAVLRLLIALAFAALAFSSPGPYGFALGVAPLAIAVPVLWGQRRLLEPGPEAPWKELSTSLGALLTGSVLAQLLVNAGPVLLEVLASSAEKAEVGKFTAALIIARIPLFLFQAVQAALLPRLAAVAAEGRFEDFRGGLARLLVLLGAIALVGTAVSFAVGPFLVERFFGSEYAGIANHTTGFLALGTAAYVVAMAVGQANIALGGARYVAIGWGIGVVTVPVVVAVVPGLLERVEYSYVAGSVVAAAAMGVFLLRQLATGATVHEGDLVEAMLDLPLEP